jgi:nucleoside-diphosphate-sugar epimerase
VNGIAPGIGQRRSHPVRGRRLADRAHRPDKRDYIVSNARIEATGYRPQYSIEDGIRELVKGYRMIRNTVYGNV